MLASIIAALGMTADGVAEGLYAARHRFTARAAGVAYAIGALVAWLAGAVTPITFTVESITVATRTVQTRPQILYVVVLSAIPSVLLGLFGLYSEFIDLLNPSVISGVIAGVGIILAGVGVEYVRERPVTAGSSILAGFVLYLLTGNLVLVIVAAVAAGTLAARLLPTRFRPRVHEPEEGGDDGADGEAAPDGLELLPLKWQELLARPVLIGAFSVFALRTGAVVSYDTVNAEIADASTHFDAVTLMAGLGSLASGLLGGPPVETTPAPMAAAPMPVFSTVLFMALMVGVTLLGLVGRLGRYFPLQAIAGFLVVLGVPVVLPENIPMAMEDPVPGATALAITALSNPFYGILAGELVAVAMDLGLDAGTGD